MTAPGRKPDPPPPIWSCEPRTIVCRYRHPHIRVRDDSMNVQYRVDGHVYQECPKCAPHSYAFGVVHVRPFPLVTLYACTKAQYEHILALPDDAETLDILRYLGYHPAP